MLCLNNCFTPLLSLLRFSLCKALVTAASIQDRSLSLLTTLTDSLLLSFTPSEAISNNTRVICSTALLKISSLARRGFLQGSRATAQSLANLISAYTLRNTSSLLPSAFASTYPVTRAVSALIEGVQLWMASGEVPVTLVSPNMQIAMSSALITTSGNSSFETPGTASQTAYGAIQPKITLGSGGLSSCPFTGGYTQVSVLQWIINPYASSTAVRSPLLRVTVTNHAAAIITSPIVTSQVQRNKVVFTLPGVPAYYVTIQFSSEQSFNFSAISSNTTATTRGKSNFTLPACTLYNGVAYVPCKGCNISSYTDFNVTYSCFDISQLCPTVSSTRFLQYREYENTGALLVEGDDDDDDDDEDIEVVDNMQGRHLSAADDDESVAAVSGTTYATILQSIAAELSSVLSSNPFKLDVAQSVVVLTFVGCLGGFIILMLIYLLRLDKDEQLYKIYVKGAADAIARKKIEEELEKGGKGDSGLSFHKHVKDMNDSLKAGCSMISILKRTTSKKEMNYSYKGEEMKTYETDDESDISTNGGDDICKEKRGRYATVSVVTEFAHNLFPGSSIFAKKRNFLEIISVYHDYFAMLAGSTLNKSRTVRFLHLVSIVLTLIFVDTIFFGIYFPGNSTCTIMTDKVGQTLTQISSIRNINFTIIIKLVSVYLRVYVLSHA